MTVIKTGKKNLNSSISEYSNIFDVLEFFSHERRMNRRNLFSSAYLLSTGVNQRNNSVNRRD